MVKDATASEYLLTQKTAEEYRSKGYEVCGKPHSTFCQTSEPISSFG